MINLALKKPLSSLSLKPQKLLDNENFLNSQQSSVMVNLINYFFY